MKRFVWVLVLAFAFACDREKKGGIRDVTAEQVADVMAAKSAIILDANTDSFRQQNGVVPGAVLLANYLDWDPPTTLGPDKGKQVIFYCSNTF